MDNNIMLTVTNTKNELDCPEGMQVYFQDKKQAIEYGKRYIEEHGLYMAVIRKLTSGIGHYKTLAYVHNPKMV